MADTLEKTCCENQALASGQGEPDSNATCCGEGPILEVLPPDGSPMLLAEDVGQTDDTCCQDQPQVEIRTTTSDLSRADRIDHILARLGYRRSEHRVDPGLYAMGRPTPESSVFVTANYSLSFDALRPALAGRDAYILVLDTKGINVWCAAGKGTFGTDELVRRIMSVSLGDVVTHRRLVLPQLGATGVSAHEVRRRTGFRVEYGPVRADDLPAYLEAGVATPEMRRVTFTLAERTVLIPIELKPVLGRMAIAAVVLYALGGVWGALAAIGAVLAGTTLFPLLLPWLPTKEFTTKGMIIGAVVALFVAWGAYSSQPNAADWVRSGSAIGYLLAMPAVSGFLALNFTGATPITSQSGVKQEMFRYIRIMAGMAGVGALLILASGIGRWIGG